MPNTTTNRALGFLALSSMIDRMMNESSSCVPQRIIDAAPANLREALESASDQFEAFLALTGVVQQPDRPQFDGLPEEA